ncbi:hypothetical protein [Mesorhizobium sp. CCNWLW179]
MYILMARRNVAEIRDQPPAVRYFDRDGHSRHHWFDLEVHLTNGTRYALAVKQESQVDRSGILETLDLIREQRPAGCAEHIALRTERQITRVRADNARLIVRANGCRREDDVEQMRTFVQTLRGSAKIGDVLRASNADARGFMAIVCLIFDGDLVTVGTNPITSETQIHLSGTEQIGGR